MMFSSQIGNVDLHQKIKLAHSAEIMA